MRTIHSILGATLLTASFATASADTQLPTVTIMGKTFYTYVAKKGESLFGIANRFGWDPTILAETNKELETPLSNGDLIYYPAAKSSGKKNARPKEASADSSTGPVASGEADEDERPLTVVVASEEEVELNPEADTERDGVVYHEVQKEESLYDIARTYETTVEDLYKMNPGMSFEDPEPGETIRLKAGSLNDKATPAMVEEQQVSGVTTYKVRRGDDWAKVADKYGISVSILKESNPGVTKLKRGDFITIPSVETVEVERMVVTTDPREATEEGRRELYQEVHSLDSKIYDADGNISPNAVSVAIVLGEPDTNRDMEFARGAILAVDQLKTASFPTRLTIIDGSQPENEVIESLEGFNPRLIITTADKDLPSYIAEYAKENEAHVVNSFDVKDEAYLTNSAMIQYLAPTSYFNEEVADWIADKYAGYRLIIGGKMDGADTMGESIIRAWVAAEGEMPEEVVTDEIATMTLPEEDGRYLIYATPAGKEDVRSLLEKIERLRETNPLADIRVVGRPSWITMTDSQRKAFENNNVLLPTRFYFNSEDDMSRRFIDDYKALYGHTPMKSYPVYSAAGHDIINYFLPNISMTGGDFNAEFRERPTLQSPISLERVNNWGGVVNPCVYVVEFAPYGGVKKILLNSED